MAGALLLESAGIAAQVGDDNGNGGDAGGGHTKALRAQKIQLNRDTSEPTDVYSWFEITLKAIDVPSQTFDCSIEVHLFWQDFNLPNIFPDFDKEDFSIDDDDVPVKMSEIFENKLSCDLEGDPQFQYWQETGTIYMMFVVECTFVERMELQRFPLDRQFLNMEFNAWVQDGNWNWTLERGLDWVPEKWRNEQFAVRMVSSITEYQLLGPWIDFEKEDQPLSIRLRVNRIPTYYFGNIVFPNFLIVAGCFAAFAVPRGEVADRLSVTVTLMLAAVAFRFVVSTMLPKVAYLTVMDKYLLVGFIALIILIAENAAAGLHFVENDMARTIDYAVGLGFGAFWILLHVIATIALVKEDFWRVSWAEMDRIDSEEDPDAEFVKAESKYIITPDESEFCKQTWSKIKLRSPTTRAKIFEMEHPEVAEKNRSQNVEDEEEAGTSGGDAVVNVPSKMAALAIAEGAQEEDLLDALGTKNTNITAANSTTATEEQIGNAIGLGQVSNEVPPSYTPPNKTENDNNNNKNNSKDTSNYAFNSKNEQNNETNETNDANDTTTIDANEIETNNENDTNDANANDTNDTNANEANGDNDVNYDSDVNYANDVIKSLEKRMSQVANDPFDAEANENENENESNNVRFESNDDNDDNDDNQDTQVDNNDTNVSNIEQNETDVGMDNIVMASEDDEPLPDPADDLPRGASKEKFVRVESEYAD